MRQRDQQPAAPHLLAVATGAREHQPHGGDGDGDPTGDKAPRCGGSSWARSDGAAWPPRVPTPCWGACPWAPLGAGVRRPVPSPCRGPGGCAPADGRERRNYLRRAGGEPGCGLMNNAMKWAPRADFLLMGAGTSEAVGPLGGAPRGPPPAPRGSPRIAPCRGGIFDMAVPMATEQNGAGIRCQGKGPRSTRGRGQHCRAVPWGYGSPGGETCRAPRLGVISALALVPSSRSPILCPFTSFSCLSHPEKNVPEVALCTHSAL